MIEGPKFREVRPRRRFILQDMDLRHTERVSRESLKATIDGLSSCGPKMAFWNALSKRLIAFDSIQYWMQQACPV